MRFNIFPFSFFAPGRAIRWGNKGGLRASRSNIIPLYLFITEKIVSDLNLAEFNIIEENLDKIIKQRDDLVAQLYRTMRFLATVMIFVFLLEVSAISFKGEVWGMTLKADQDELVFGLLLIGNLIALLFATAMTKMFMVEFLLKGYFYVRGAEHGTFIKGIAYRFYAFTFGLIAEQGAGKLPPRITRTSQAIHSSTVVVLPLSYMIAYVGVLFVALRGFWRHHPGPILILGHHPQFWYLSLLAFFNALTLSVYAFVFFPCRRPVLQETELDQQTATRAYQLWVSAERPTGKDDEIWLVAERQIKMLHHRCLNDQP